MESSIFYLQRKPHLFDWPHSVSPCIATISLRRRCHHVDSRSSNYWLTLHREAFVRSLARVALDMVTSRESRRP